jgi:WS/DGAT/MGAT family acyltransferase
MSSVDAAWRHMEDATNLMMVTGIMQMKGEVSREAILETLEKGFLVFNRMRQKVRDFTVFKTPHWVSVKELNMDEHVVEEQLPLPATRSVIQQRVSELLSTPLDFKIPLWHLTLLRGAPEGTVVLIRIHHCIADGIALVGVLLSMTGKSPEESLAITPAKVKNYPQLSSSGYLFRRATTALDTAVRTTNWVFQRSLDALSKPERIIDLARFGTEGSLSAARILLKPSDPETIFKGPLNEKKVAAWSDPISLEKVKEIRQVTASTVNDVLLAALSGALNRYLKGKHEQTQSLEISAAVPVNLRRPQDAGKLGNQFGLVFLTLPVGIDDPLDRVFEVKRRMDEIKNSPDAIVALGMLKSVGLAPAEVQKTIVNVLGTKITAVMTNVPGPLEPLFLAGHQINSMMFWVPCSGRAGMGISILSYAGEVRLGVATDFGLIPDPDQIIHGFYEEFDALYRLVTQVKDEA